MKNFTIREGVFKDIPEIYALIKELAEFEKSPDSVINSVEKMQTEYDYYDFFVAEKDGRIIGMALYFIAYYTWVGKSLYLDDLYIKEEYRGNNIGKALLKEIFKIAKRENCNRVRWQVLDWNVKAIDFYKKLNANIDSTWLNCDFNKKNIKQVLEKLN